MAAAAAAAADAAEAAAVAEERAEVEAFLKEHALEETLSEILNELVVERPADPFRELGARIGDRSSGANQVQRVRASVVLSADGTPALEAEVITEKGSFRASAAPGVGAGGAGGTKEDMEAAALAIRDRLGPLLFGQPVMDQKGLDEILTDAHAIPPVAVLATSMAICRAGAAHRSCEVFEHIASIRGEASRIRVPVPIAALIAGGSLARDSRVGTHCLRLIGVQPLNAASFQAAVDQIRATQAKLHGALAEECQPDVVGRLGASVVAKETIPDALNFAAALLQGVMSDAAPQAIDAGENNENAAEAKISAEAKAAEDGGTRSSRTDPTLPKLGLFVDVGAQYFALTNREDAAAREAEGKQAPASKKGDKKKSASPPDPSSICYKVGAFGADPSTGAGVNCQEYTELLMQSFSAAETVVTCVDAFHPSDAECYNRLSRESGTATPDSGDAEGDDDTDAGREARTSSASRAEGVMDGVEHMQLAANALVATEGDMVRWSSDGSLNTLMLTLEKGGTVSGCVAMAEKARALGWAIMCSPVCESPQACDAFLAQLAVGVDAGQILIGALRRGESADIYNELGRIATSDGAPRFAGNPFRPTRGVSRKSTGDGAPNL